MGKRNFRKSVERSVRSTRRDLSLKIWKNFYKRQSVSIIKKTLRMKNLGAKFSKTAV